MKSKRHRNGSRHVQHLLTNVLGDITPRDMVDRLPDINDDDFHLDEKDAEVFLEVSIMVADRFPDDLSFDHIRIFMDGGDYPFQFFDESPYCNVFLINQGVLKCQTRHIEGFTHRNKGLFISAERTGYNFWTDEEIDVMTEAGWRGVVVTDPERPGRYRKSSVFNFHAPHDLLDEISKMWRWEIIDR